MYMRHIFFRIMMDQILDNINRCAKKAASLAFVGLSIPGVVWAQATTPAPSADGGPQPAMTDIHDIKPALAVGPELGWLWWLLAAALIIAAAALVWWLWRKRRGTGQAVPVIPLPSPEAQAYERLDALAADRQLDDKQYYFQLSAILRHYVERRYDIPAAEMTMEELLPHMEQLPIPKTVGEPFKQFCRAIEPIKFADAPADQTQKPNDLAFARDFVRDTTPVAMEEKPLNG